MAQLEFLQEEAEKQAEVCKVFAYPRRILILWALESGDLTVGEIAKAVGESVQNTSHHLRLMKGIGILAATREGKTIRYSIADHNLCDCLLKNAVQD
jgi:DNA-binding transcriptional ArsR family regulator